MKTYVSTVGLALLVGCSSGGGGAGGGGAAGTGGGTSSSSTSTSTSSSSGTGGAAPGSCNALVNMGSNVAETAVSGTMPTGTGGTIVDGTYVLTKVETYPGSPLKNLTFNQTLQISGTNAQLVADDSDKPQFRESFTVTTAGNVPTITTTCTTEMPPVDIPYSTFTATSASLTLFCSAYAFAVTYTKTP